MNLLQVESGLTGAGIPADLVRELLESYEEAKRRYHLGDHRPNAVEGGRFAEAAFRILQHLSGQTVTPLGRMLPSVPTLVSSLENVPSADAAESIRLHIPRALRVIYGVRNSRDAAHLADGIDPNLQDATLVVGVLDWVVAELVRLHHAVTADEARALIEELVTKEVPAVQEIDGHPVILKDLQARDQALLLLYRAGTQHGLSVDELASWLRITRKDNLRARLRKLDEQRLAFDHPKTGRFHITSRGIHYVEDRGLARPI